MTNTKRLKLTSQTMRGFSFSLKRFLGITQVKQQIARETGIPTTKSGLERKIGKAVIKAIFGKK
ncbi:MAG: hypothetical protein Q7U47_09350 [Paludibacter sp.]|nr:hypothetical protein [Paludibacter sp.]